MASIFRQRKIVWRLWVIKKKWIRIELWTRHSGLYSDNFPSEINYREINNSAKKNRRHGECAKWSPALVTNQIFVCALVPRRTKEKGKQKGERPEQPKPNFLPKSNLIKSNWSMMIVHIIFDLMGNDLQNQFMTYLWFGIKTKTLAYTPCAVFLCSIGPSVSSNVLLEMKF